MSEFINNREYRKNTLKSILAQLHEGKAADEVREQFSKAFDGVSAEEISQAEQALIREGISIAEVQRLCDVHAEVFKGAIEEIHQPAESFDIPGHPVNIMKQENRAIEELISLLRSTLSGVADINVRAHFTEEMDRLYAGVDIHYKKKENLLFPYMEQYDITAPPKVMWGVDDEIRDLLRAVQAASEGELPQKAEEAFTKTIDMIFKEEHILLPILQENLTQAEWGNVADESAEFGYCLIDEAPEWKPQSSDPAQIVQRSSGTMTEGIVTLPTGSFTIEELTCLLNTLPIDITFVGKDDTVRYFSQSNERIFPRTPSVIGRNVSNCHPPASVHVVEKLVADFKDGVKDSEDFRIRMGDKYILILYFAVRNTKDEYLGMLEVTQNIAPIQKLTGEKRLVSD